MESGGQQGITGINLLNDAIKLAETPASQWENEDDGFNEVQQAREALDWISRHGPQAQDGLGDDYLTDNEDMQKREAAGIRWGVDWDSEIEW